MAVDIEKEIKNRRTAAIIAHPDAGKTTLTEKLLLYSGAIHRAGSVKGRKADRHATSDWMDMEKERGISITSSVMQFSYDEKFINLLDTPGHADFSADTYRTLVAADSAIIVIDGTRGVEKQTRKLFKFCCRHEIPYFMFINKLDRFGLDPLDLIEELENEFDIRMYPFNWPVGKGKNFKGIYDRREERMIFYEKGEKHGQEKLDTEKLKFGDEKLKENLGAELYKQLKEEIELLDIAGDNFERKDFLRGQQVPMFFGSAQTNFGVRPFLKGFVDIAPDPRPRGGINPTADYFSGYIFKIQANMDPNHRDRLAFMRVCSGVFEKGMEATIERNKETVRLAQPRQFMARERELIETAYPGDVIGLFDPGIFHIGDSLSSGEAVEYNEVPRFSPEHFALVKSDDAFKRKHLNKGLSELAEEGAVQVFEPWEHSGREFIIGVVGQLQFEVIEYRLKEEYGVEVRLQKLPFKHARWIEGKDLDPKTFNRGSYRKVLKDKDGYPILLFKTKLTLRRDKQDNPDVTFSDTAPLHR
ncbi:MAG: peptide chain release factor 3 [bacterium]